MEKLRSNEKRGKNAILLIWIVLTIQVLSLISNYFQYNLLQRASNGENITTLEANANDFRQQIIAIIFLILYIVSCITFIQWFRRAYFNLHVKRSQFLTFTEGWAAGSWFVPIVNLFRPYLIMKEIYEETNKLFKYNNMSSDSHVETEYLGWWWGLWIISGIFGQVVYRYSRIAISIDELTTSTILAIIDVLLGIVLATITIKIIKDYTKLEPLIFEIKETDTIEPKVEVINA